MEINWFSVCKAVAVRCLLTFHVIMCNWRVVVDLADQQYWYLLCGLLPLICETCYTLVKRHGVEFSRFTPCFLCYLAAVLPGIWLLELNKTDGFIKFKDGNMSWSVADNKTSDISSFQEMLDTNTWLIVIEEMLPYVIFASRWVLPRGRVRREELAELLFAFIEIAADIMEFFSLIGDDVIRGNKTLSCCVLGIWSLSILQFTMTVTVIHQPKKEKKVSPVHVESNTDKEKERVRHECYAIFLTMAMQDLPFAIMRLYTIINFNYINYSLIFFTSKNIIIIMLLLYKVTAICKKQYLREHEDCLPDTDKKTPTNIDRAEEGSHHTQDIFTTSKIDGINHQKVRDSKNEQYNQYNYFNEDGSSVLKKRSRKSETPNRESPDSGRTTPRSIARSTTETEETSSRQSVHLQKTDSVGCIPLLCPNCLSHIEITPDVRNNLNIMNVRSDFRNESRADEGVQHLLRHTEDVENTSRHSQGFIGDIESPPEQENFLQTNDIIKVSPDRPLASLVLSLGSNQQQVI